MIANQLQNIQTMKLSEADNLPGVLSLRTGAQVMINSNINIDDRLINWLVGQVVQFFIGNRHVISAFLNFDDVNIGWKQ